MWDVWFIGIRDCGVSVLLLLLWVCLNIDLFVCGRRFVVMV